MKKEDLTQEEEKGFESIEKENLCLKSLFLAIIVVVFLYVFGVSTQVLLDDLLREPSLQGEVKHEDN